MKKTYEKDINNCNIRVTHGDDGIFLHFTSDGGSLCFGMEINNLAEEQDSDCLKKWCEERREQIDISTE